MCLERSINGRHSSGSTAQASGSKTPVGNKRRAEAAVASDASCPLHLPSVLALREQAPAETTCRTWHPYRTLISGSSPLPDLGSNPALDTDWLCGFG